VVFGQNPREASQAARVGFANPKAGQMVGQPASPGPAQGPARIIGQTADLFSFKTEDGLVCDAVDPGLAFVVRLAVGIVERRGGILIRGSIIAPESGIWISALPGSPRPPAASARERRQRLTATWKLSY
jgi:pyruvate,water dikinase